MVTLLYRILKQILGYDTEIWGTWVTAAGNNNAFKTAAKPQQIKTWLLLTAYSNLLSPYPTVSSQTSYDVPFSHNTCVTKRQTTDKRHIVPKAGPSGRPKTATVKLCRFSPQTSADRDMVTFDSL